MSANGLQVFDRTLQITNIWLNDISETVGPDRKLAWAVLGAVLRTLRDRVPSGVSAHLAAELPLLIRGAYYDHYQPERQPTTLKSADQFLQEVQKNLTGQRPVNVDQAVRAVFDVLTQRTAPGTCEKVCLSLPEDIRRLWSLEQPGEVTKARPGESPGAPSLP